MIIGLHGAAGSGKDTAADILQSELSGVVYRASFAFPIYAAFEQMFPTLRSAFFNREAKEAEQVILNGKSVRFALQTLGTEWGRKLIDEDIWINSLISRLDALGVTSEDFVVITDVRFENEAAWIVDRGGEIWQIIRDSRPVPDNAAHASERPLPVDLISRTVYNNGSIADFKDALSAAFADAFSEEIL